MYRQYFLPSFEEFNFFCFPHSLGKYTQPDNHNVLRSEGTRDFSLHFIVEGKGFIEIEDTLYTLKKGDAFLHYPHQQMRYYTSSTEPWDIYWIQFNGSGLLEFMLERGFHESSVWCINNSNMLEQAYLELIKEMQQHKFMRPPKLSALTYSIIVEFVSSAIAFTTKRGNQNTDKIIKLLPLMQQMATRPFELEEWALKVDLTPNYFCSLFKRVTRMTPLSYITKCRIQYSKQLLLSSLDMAVKEVAISSGYTSISYFNKIFMQAEGLTPTKFREVHLKKR
ncbi:helix-turn-helix domain-containing protein [Paenibacillus sp. FSL R5-0519]|uniref:AraC family transcriptional regulator n=1 Tax=Paenibacillus sp. FSL R5-0519 TaxID=2921648 RepID=UPI0030DBA229